MAGTAATSKKKPVNHAGTFQARLSAAWATNLGGAGAMRFAYCALRAMTCLRRTSRRSVDDHAVEIDVHIAGYDRRTGQHFRRRVPGLLLDDAILDCFGNQLSDLLALQRNERSITVIFVKLGTIIEGMNPWIVSFEHEEVLGFKKNIVLSDDLLFLRGQSNAELFS